MAYQEYGNTGYQYQQNPDGSYSVINPAGNQLNPQLAQQYVSMAQHGFTPNGMTGQFTKTNPDGSVAIQSVAMPGQQMTVQNPSFSPTSMSTPTSSTNWNGSQGANALQQALGIMGPSYGGPLTLQGPSGSQNLQMSPIGNAPQLGQSISPQMQQQYQQQSTPSQNLAQPSPQYGGLSGFGGVNGSAQGPQSVYQGPQVSAMGQSGGFNPFGTLMGAMNGMGYGGFNPYAMMGGMGGGFSPYGAMGGYNTGGQSPFSFATPQSATLATPSAPTMGSPANSTFGSSNAWRF